MTLTRYEREAMRDAMRLAAKPGKATLSAREIIEQIDNWQLLSPGAIDVITSKIADVTARPTRATAADTIHARLVSLVARCGGQSGVARILGKSQPLVNHWLNSKRSERPSVEDEAKLLAYAQLDFAWLYADLPSSRIWDAAEIRAELSRRGMTLGRLCPSRGQKRDRAISEFLAVPLSELWPERYDAAGNRIAAAKGGK